MQDRYVPHSLTHSSFTGWPICMQSVTVLHGAANEQEVEQEQSEFIQYFFHMSIGHSMGTDGRHAVVEATRNCHLVLYYFLYRRRR